MSWNYRVIRSKPYTYPDGYVEYDYSIREVYYKRSGKIKAWSSIPVKPRGSSEEELKKDLLLMMKAFSKPILKEKRSKKKKKIKLVDVRS